VGYKRGREYREVKKVERRKEKKKGIASSSFYERERKRFFQIFTGSNF
jgi:hypothetical protein